MKRQNYHEQLVSGDLEKRSTERSFGLTICIALLVLAAWLWWHEKSFSQIFALGGVAFGSLALLAPGTLKLPNFLWSRFGELLHHAMSPIVISAIFFLIFTPVGLLMRLLGRRPLSHGFDSETSTYWIERTPRGPQRGTLNRQF